MKVVVQRVLNAHVTVDNNIVGKIDQGLVILVGFTLGDTTDDINYMVDKVINLRIFDDENHIMNKSISDVKGSILSISQFTLYANANKGRRPSYDLALNKDEAIKLYEEFNKGLKESGIKTETGIFKADMQVSLVNDGPITIIIESRNK